MIEIDETIRDYGYLNFETVEPEEWSIYKLEDETILKLKVTPLKFLRKNSDILINPMILVVPFAPEKLKGEGAATPTPTTQNQIMEQVDKPDVKFEVMQEPWNEYKLDNDVHFFAKVVAVIVSHTKLFDTEGEPVYLVNHQLFTKKHPLF